MKTNKAILTIALIVFLTSMLLFGTAAAGTERPIYNGDLEEFGHMVLSLLQQNNSLGSGSFENLSDSLEIGIVGVHDKHFVRFSMVDSVIRLGGAMIFTFPGSFDVATLTSFGYFDDDADNTDPAFISSEIAGGSIKLNFDTTGNLPAINSIITIELDSIMSDTIAGEYRVAVVSLDSTGALIAGPALTSIFRLKPDELASVAIDSAWKVRDLNPGQTIKFICRGWDNFGNERSDLEPEWEVLPWSSIIGEISQNGVFLAKYKGTSLIACQVDTFADTTTLVYVRPGRFSLFFDHYQVSGFPDSVSAGIALTDSIYIGAKDFYNNTVIDSTGQFAWFETTDTSAIISPNSVSPFGYTLNCPAEQTFPGNNFIFRTAGLQSIYLTDGTNSSDTFNILVKPGGVADFDLSVPTVATAGEPFEIGVSNVTDFVGNHLDKSVIVELITAGESPGGDMPQVSSFFATNGSGTGWQTLVRAGTAKFRVTIGGVAIVSNVITVSNAEADNFEFYVSSPQIINVVFTDSVTIRAFDHYGNTAVDFDASTDQITLQPDVQPSVINSATAFTSGFCDLTLVDDFKYEGEKRFLTFTATSTSGATGTSNIVEINSSTIEQLSIGKDQYKNGDTLTASVIIYNFGSYSMRVEEIKLISSQGEMNVISHSPSLPDMIEGNSSHQYELKSIIPETFDPQWTWFKSGFNGFYNEQPISHETDYGDSARILSQQNLVYSGGSFSPVTVTRGESYQFTCGVEHFGAFNIYLYNSSFMQFVSEADDTFKAYLAVPIYVTPPTEEPVTLLFNNEGIDSLFEPGRYAVELNLRGQLGFSNYSEVIILSDSVNVQTPSSLRFEDGSFLPTAAFRGMEIAPSLNVINDGLATLVLNHDQSWLHLISGDNEIRFSLAEPDVSLEPGVNTLQFESKVIQTSFPTADNSLFLDLSGIENGHTRTTSLSLGDNLLDCRRQATARLISVTAVTPNVPKKVNIGKPFDIIIEVANEGEENLDSVFITLSSDGSSDFDSLLFIDLISIEATRAMTVGVVASSIPNPSEEFEAEIVSARGVISGQAAEILPYTDNAAAVNIQTPAEISVSAQIDSPPSAISGNLSSGQGFHVSASFENSGQASAGYGWVRLFFSDANFETLDDTLIEFAVDDIVGWDISAPQAEGEYKIFVELDSIPVDSNTGEQAMAQIDSVAIPVVVQAVEPSLQVAYSFYSLELVSPGEEFDILEMTFTALTDNPEAEIRLDELSLNLSDRNGSAVAATELLIAANADDDVHDFNGSLSGDRVVFSFDDNIIVPPDMPVNMTVSFTLNRNYSSPSFFVGIDSNSVVATDVTYGVEGSKVSVADRHGSVLDVQKGYGMVANDLEASFYNYPNPFAAGREETNIVYFLAEPSDVTLEIYTLIGEKVFSEEIRSGELGAIAGEKNILIWDGRNSRGDIIRNGVYIAVLKLSSGSEARRKIAVVK